MAQVTQTQYAELAMPHVIQGDANYYDKRPRCKGTGKVVFYFEWRAAVAVERIEAQNDGAEAGKWNYYPCRYCRFWHVGHKRVGK